jgi:hypothetical protein
MTVRIYRPLKVIAFNANGIWRRRYELSKLLQDLHIDVAQLSETQLKPRERFIIPNYHFYRTDTSQEESHRPILFVQYVHLRKAKPTHNRQTYPLVRDDVTQGLWQQGFSCKVKGSLVVNLKGLGAKKNWLVVSSQS